MGGFAKKTEAQVCSRLVEHDLVWRFIPVILADVKTAVSLPDDVFRAVDAYAKRHRLTRSGVLAAAARQFLARKSSPQSATEAWNRAVEAAGQPGSDPASVAFRRRTKDVIRKSRRR
jgi:predicted transcriptional regulator